MLKNIIIKYKRVILLSIGLLLVSLSIILLLYSRFMYIKEEVFSNISLLKYNEEMSNKSSEEPIDNEEIIIETEYIEDNTSSEKKEDPPKETSNKKFIGYLEINKINLKYGLVAKNSYYNNVNRNIQILSISDMPDVNKGNLILAAHSGTSEISYFRNLYKLSKGDMAKVYYGTNIYNYKIVNIYNVSKTGSLDIYRDTNKTCLTLITCTKNSKTEQTVYILELMSITRNGADN